MTKRTTQARGRASRRQVLAGAGALAIAGVIALPGGSARAQAGAGEFAAALKKTLGDAQAKDGKVAIQAPEIAENGATVPVIVRVDTPVTADSYVRRITLLADGNPNPEVAVFTLTPRSGKAEVSTRLRLAKTQNVVAVAELSDKSLWMTKKEIKVTIGGCGG
ncbi:MAG: thiosulfate oxidation carrier protein SoxY [Alphaproteobacteria bacterium]|nr:thiosulfate oxidation carrier protein SoxY [Alphaproteobacteria bacterium]